MKPPQNTGSTSSIDQHIAPPRVAPPRPAPDLLAARDLADFRFETPLVDVRGWMVLSAEGDRIGTVDSILIDTHTLHPRYLAISSPERAGHLLLPVGFGTLRRSSRKVQLSEFRHDDLNTLPRLIAGRLTRPFEQRLLEALPRPGATPRWRGVLQRRTIRCLAALCPGGHDPLVATT